MILRNEHVISSATGTVLPSMVLDPRFLAGMTNNKYSDNKYLTYFRDESSIIPKSMALDFYSYLKH